jgi:hypothetical protein
MMARINVIYTQREVCASGPVFERYICTHLGKLRSAESCGIVCTAQIAAV